MGRIAEALKRAEHERRLALGTQGAESARPAIAAAAEAVDSPVNAAEVPITERRAGEPRLVQGLSESLVPFFERTSVVTEQYRALRTRLLSQNPNYEHRIIAVTSAVPKEGKSVTTLNLGCILAEIRHLNVLVVDGDFRRSSLAAMLNQKDSDTPGLAEVLNGDATYEQALRKTPIPNLTFIAAGQARSGSAPELWTASRTAQIFRRMQNDFHYAIVDTPPAITVTDVGVIGQLCSGVIVVVRLNRTDEQASKRAVRLLQVNNIPILGCLLVGRDAPTGRYGYGYNYYYSYRYYDYYNKSQAT